MDITVKPDVVEETLTDYDFAFVGGVTESITVRDEDRVQVVKELGMKFTIVNPPEIISIFNSHLLVQRVRQRTVQTPVKKEKA